jgi:hypothetical protein
VRCTILDSLVSNQNVLIKTTRNSHRIMPIEQPSSIPPMGLRESILSLPLVIHVNWEMLPAAGFISTMVPEPPLPSWQACVRTSMGLTLYEKRERVSLCPSLERKGGSWVVSPELVQARAMPIHISRVLTRIDSNLIEEK